MRPVVTNGVASSVGLFVTIVSRAKAAEPIDMPFGLWTLVIIIIIIINIFNVA